MKQFITHSVHIFSKINRNINRTESNDKDCFNMSLNISFFKTFAFLYRRALAGAALKFLFVAGAA
jgi:hypothetical protein